MKKKSIVKLFSATLFATAALTLVSCGPTESTATTGSVNTGSSSTKKGNGTTYDNETAALVMSSQDVDKVFNPYYSSAAADSSVISMTQIGMLGNDKNGNVTTRKDGDSVIVYDYESKYDDSTKQTTYKFVLSNDIKFSNGTPLTIKDVLFNLYEYLDPLYAGSSTIYSTKIVGLQQYRTQQADEKDQDEYKAQFQVQASTRISSLADIAAEIIDDYNNDESQTGSLTKDYFVKKLQENVLEDNEAYKYLVEDFNKACELFTEEINDDYNNSKDNLEADSLTFYDKDKQIVYFDTNGNIVTDGSSTRTNPFTTDVEVFLYNEGFITWSAKDKAFTASTTANFKDYAKMSEADAKSLVIGTYIPSKIDQVISYWATATNLYDYITNDLIEKYVAANGQTYSNISGISFANVGKEVSVNGTTYKAVKSSYTDTTNYNADGSCKDGFYEVLQIVIEDQDPKAIWNFAFGVAPMYYYSNEEQISKFDYQAHFGVEYSSQTFQNNVVKNPDKISVPVGAGAYMAVNKDGSSTNVTAGGFFDGTTIYFQRNPYFKDAETGKPAVIKNVQFRIVPTTGLTNSLYAGEVDYCEPNAKTETVAELKTKKSSGIGSQEVRTSGYGYIGINAGKVESIYVRQAIMHCIDTQEIVNYYGTSASAIYRSMSKENWAYPDGCTAYYPYIKDAVPSDLSVVSSTYANWVTQHGYTSGQKLSTDDQAAFITYLIEHEGGYSKDSYGSYSSLKYTFTIAGGSEDHPAFSALTHAASYLNDIGLNITVSKDSNALTKLTTGALDVWAAAWSSTIDPDMYQVYHKDSSATSVKCWGYPEILRNTTKYSTEYAIIDELSELIEKGRETLNQETRKKVYSEALDKVMELAVELPTYQRTDLFAYNEYKIDTDTFVQDVSSYKGLTSNLWTVSLIK